ncbi:hypothetical protein BX666DRAFT_1960037 [Dichotomocladium elegans]|nr:hypothetical protein BX666DRAFT_1960037 [Dichotomocladium elegans]
MNLILGGNVKWPQEKLPARHVLLSHHHQQQHTSRFLIAERMACLARSRMIFALAELAGLGLREIMAGVATAPLLSSLGIRPMTPARFRDAPVIKATGIYSKEQWMAVITSQSSSSSSSDKDSPMPIQQQLRCREEERLQSFMQHLAHHPLWKGMHQSHHDETSNDLWSKFASWFGDYHLHPKQRASFLTTLKTQRQQQAIIQSRQRRLVPIATTTAASGSDRHSAVPKCVKKRRSNHNTALPQPQDDQRSSSSSSLSSRSSTPPPLPIPIHRRFAVAAAAAATPTATGRSLLPDSDPGDHNTSTIRSLHSAAELRRPVPCKISSSSVELPPPWSQTSLHRRPTPRKWTSLHDLRGGESNLDLLATQATQRLPLPPLSSPPYHRHHQQQVSSIQLPPPREMLARPPPPSGMV